MSLLAVWCLIGATPRGQPWTPAVTLPPGCDGLSARRMAVLWTFREPSLCCHVRRAFMRNVLLDFTPILPATACHQRNDVETYSRYMCHLLTRDARHVIIHIPLCSGGRHRRSPPWGAQSEQDNSLASSLKPCEHPCVLSACR